MKTLKELHMEMEGCRGCGLEGKGYPVFSGNEEQDVMIIGYKPKSEDGDLTEKQVIPLLSSILSKIDFDKNKGAYITYLLRCFVDDDLYTNEVKAICKEYLKDEIFAVKPKYIVITGEDTAKDLGLPTHQEEFDGDVLGYFTRIYLVSI